jgi:hypothetical protein
VSSKRKIRSKIRKTTKTAKKRFWFYLLAAPIVMVVYLLVAELALWGFLAFQLKAASQNLTYRFESKESLKILCVGDSHTKGEEAPEGHAYPDYLKGLIEDRCPGAHPEILNFGFVGWDMTRLLAYTTKLVESMEIKPDVMILQGGINAYENWEYVQRYFREEKIIVPFWYRVFSKSMISRFTDAEEVARSYEGADYDKFVRKMTHREYFEFIDFCNRHHIRLVFLSYASAYGPKEELINEEVAPLAKKYNIPFIRFAQPMTHDTLTDHGWIAPRRHPTREGYEWIAGRVFNRLMVEIPQLNGCKASGGKDEFPVQQKAKAPSSDETSPGDTSVPPSPPLP